MIMVPETIEAALEALLEAAQEGSWLFLLGRSVLHWTCKMSAPDVLRGSFLGFPIGEFVAFFGKLIALSLPGMNMRCVMIDQNELRHRWH